MPSIFQRADGESRTESKQTSGETSTQASFIHYECTKWISGAQMNSFGGITNQMNARITNVCEREHEHEHEHKQTSPQWLITEAHSALPWFVAIVWKVWAHSPKFHLMTHNLLVTNRIPTT